MLNLLQAKVVREFNEEMKDIRNKEKKYGWNSKIFNSMVDSIGPIPTAKQLLRTEPRAETFAHPEVTMEYLVVKYAPLFKEHFPAGHEYSFTETEVETAKGRLDFYGKQQGA